MDFPPRGPDVAFGSMIGGNSTPGAQMILAGIFRVKVGHPPLCLVASLVLFVLSSIHAQGGRTFLEWLKEYSPTGYFVINDYETRANKPGDHKKWDLGTTSPLGAVAVHETGHMRNLDLNSKNGRKSYYIGNLKDYAFTPDFKPFSSAGLIDDIPAELRNFITEVYIQAGEDHYSVGSGIIGLFEEWDQYITGLKSGVEMSACYKANFNTPKDWDALANDVTTSVWSNAEFRYFALRYILYAKTKHPEVYAKILAGQEIRQCYAYLVQFAEQTMAEWIDVLTVQKMDTKTRNGFDWHWKYWNEIQKPEYKELEKALSLPTVVLSPRGASRRGLAVIQASGLPMGAIDLRGRWISSRRPGFQGAPKPMDSSP